MVKDVHKTSCLVVKIFILSFRNPESAVSYRVILNMDLHMGFSPKVFLIDMPLATLKSAFLLYLPFNVGRKSILNKRSPSQWNMHPTWNNIMKPWNNPYISSPKQQTGILKRNEPWSQNHRIFRGEKDPQGSLSPALKWTAHIGFSSTTLVPLPTELISKVLLPYPSCLPAKNSFILIWIDSLKRSWIFLDQSSILMLWESHKISLRTKFNNTRG